MSPARIQRKRTKGWKMPANTIYVGRPGIYANPFPTAAQFREWWDTRGKGFVLWADRMDMLMGAMFQTHPHPIRGKNVACWCPLCPIHQGGLLLGVKCADCSDCHGDYVLEIANSALVAQSIASNEREIANA